MDLTSTPLLLVSMLLLLLLRHQVGALKLLNVSVPSYIQRGNPARLECRYDMGSDKLGSVLWYKDNEHIYSWTKKNYKKQTFEVTGVKIDRSRSNNMQLQLQATTLNSTGVYACEVNTDKAPFTVVRGEGYMQVVDPPKKEPKIAGEENIYATGDILALNCTSGPSYPAAHLQWFINDYQVEPESEVIQPTTRGLYITRSILRLQLEPLHVSKEKIEIRCQSTITATGAGTTLARSPYLDTRTSRIFVQGHASLSRCSTLMLSVVLLIQLLLQL